MKGRECKIKKRRFQKWQACLLAVLIAVAMLPMPALAAGETAATEEELAAAFEQGGEVTLDADITLAEPAVVLADTTLDLNGHKLEGSGRHVIEVEAGISLTIRDTQGGGSIINNSGNGDVIQAYQLNELRIEGGTIKSGAGSSGINYPIDISGQRFIMTGGEIIQENPNANSPALQLSMGEAIITGDAKITTAGMQAINMYTTSTYTGTPFIQIDGDAEIYGTISSSAEKATIGGNATITTPPSNYAFSLSGAEVVFEDNVTVNSYSRYIFSVQYNGANYQVNGGTYNQFTTDENTYQGYVHGLAYVYYATININGGVFTTAADDMEIYGDWSGHARINGGYFNVPVSPSEVPGMPDTKFDLGYQSGYAMSPDTLGNLTGNTGEYRDYYWLTKSTDVTYHVNNDASGALDTQTYTGKAYTTYADGSTAASSSSTTYTAYNTDAPYRESYHFTGWAADEDAQSGTQVVSGLTGNPTVYVVWEEGAPAYTVQYDLNGGEGNVPASAENKLVGDTVTAAAGDGLTRANYHFAGWCTDSAAAYDDADVIQGGGNFVVSDIVNSAQAAVDEEGNYFYSVTLHAVWQPKIAITFENQNVDYTGEPIAFDVTKNSENVTDGFTVTYYKDYKYEEQITDVPEGGFTTPDYYYVIVERPEDETYAAVHAEVYLRIEPIGRLSASVMNYYEMYDGNPHSVSVRIYNGPEDESQITIRYAYSQDYVADPEYTLEELPMWTDVIRNMNVYVQVSAPGYETYTGRNSVTITKADETRIVMENDTVPYDGKAHGLDTTVQSVDVVSSGTRPGTYYTDINGAVPTLTYYTDPGYQNAIEGEPVDAGTYYVKAVLEETDNYVGCEAAATLTISQTENPLAFESAAGTKHISDEAFTPALNGVTDGAAFSSNAEDVATVDETTGEITIVGSGVAVITVTVPESTNYEAAMATYTLTVTPHEYGAGVVTPPTCTEEGYTTYTCTICEESYRGDIVEATGHDWEDDFTVDQEAACTENGSQSIHCKNCDETKDSELIPAAGHSPSTEWKTDANGHWHECTVCGDKTDETAHKFEWVTDKEATPTEAGSKHEKCTICGYEKAAVEIPVIDAEDDNTQTGVDGNPLLWIGLMLISGGAALMLTAKKKRTR